MPRGEHALSFNSTKEGAIFMSTRRNNNLTSQEIDIATEPIDLGTLSYDEAVEVFIIDGNVEDYDRTL